MRTVYEIGFLGEYIGRWSEGCPCHDSLLQSGTKINCQLKGCRSPELASGSAMKGLERVWTRSRYKFLGAISGMTDSIKAELLIDWDRARSQTLAELAVKLGHWRLLPHVLCGLGHWDPHEARMSAQRALDLWARGGTGCSHAMSRRFLEATWVGLRGALEDPLRPFVEQMASGVELKDINHDGFRRWVSALTLIRVVERPVEGLHSRVNTILKRAPNASMSYISHELRWESLCQIIIGKPQARFVLELESRRLSMPLNVRRSILPLGFFTQLRGLQAFADVRCRLACSSELGRG